MFCVSTKAEEQARRAAALGVILWEQAQEAGTTFNTEMTTEGSPAMRPDKLVAICAAVSRTGCGQ
jgi:hypothetical protein